jgi:hypothetical protein
MRINNLYNEKLDDTEYKLEIRADIKLIVDGFELAKDWISPKLLEDLDILLRDCINESIVSNRSPYFFHKNPDAYYELKIKNVINQLSYATLNKDNILKRAMKNTKLSEERCLEIIQKIRPDLNL